MPPFDRLVLPDRAVIAVTGADSVTYLDNLVTNALEDLAVDDVRFAALLSPQGKILAEFFVWRTAAGFLLDTRADDAAALIKRLSMYKLRAKVEIADVSTRWSVVVAPTVETGMRADPRDARLGGRALATRADVSTSAAAYQMHRIALGVPDGGVDYPIGDIYPHEANYDRLAGVSFTKGCFVGQEVVARMQHKTVVRKRVVRIEGEGVLTRGSAVRVGEAEIGTVGSVTGQMGLALLRLDRALEARSAGTPLMAGAVRVQVDPEALDTYAVAAGKVP